MAIIILQSYENIANNGEKEDFLRRLIYGVRGQIARRVYDN
jgi:hypothetical protein